MVDNTYFHVELCTALSTRAVQRDELNTHEIITWSNTSRKSEVVPASVRDHGVDSPFAICKTIVGDFEPLKPSRASRGSVTHFRQPVTNRSYLSQSFVFVVSKT